MADTAALQQTQLIQLVVGMFNIAPGRILLDELNSYILDGGTIESLATALARSQAFKSSDFYPVNLPPEQFADIFLSKLLGNTVTDSDRSLAANVIVQMLKGAPVAQQDQLRGLAMSGAINTLTATVPIDARWNHAALQFSNRVAVASVYSVDYAGALTDPVLLHEVISAVTDSPLSVVLTLDAIYTAISSSNDSEITPPTVVATLTTYGGDGADAIVGSGGPDILIGGGGADTLTGSSGEGLPGIDVILGGAGDDTIIGAERHDSIDGGPGSDTLKLDSTNVFDTAYIQPVDLLLQNVETIDISGDTVIVVDLSRQTENFIVKLAGANGHLFTGGSGNDSITGGPGNDTIRGGGGKDTVSGGAGDDLIIGAFPGGSIDGGAGNDTLHLDGDNVLLDTYTQADDTKLTGIELIQVSGNYSQTVSLVGQSEDFRFSLTGAGHNVTSGSGKDTFLGARDIDTINGGAGIDTLKLDSATMDNGSYAPPLNSSLSGIEIIAVTDDIPLTIDLTNQTEAFTVTLVGASGHDFTGGSGADSITGSVGDDTITGGSGKDTITGGLGNDIIILDEAIAARDKIVYTLATEFGDTITGFNAGVQSTSDQIQLSATLLNAVGNSSGTAIVVSAMGNTSRLFTLNSTVILFPNVVVAGDASTANVAAELAPYGANAKYAAADKLIFGVGDIDGNTRLYYFVSDGGQDSIVDSELVLALTLIGVSTAELSATNFTQ